MEDFPAADRFYTRRWCRDLKYQFPFLDEATVRHPYQLHYYLWKLSYAYGRTYGDVSVSFEDMTTRPEKSLFEVFDACHLDLAHAETVVPLVKPPKFGKWMDYATAAWFEDMEAECQGVLQQFFDRRSGVVARQGSGIRSAASHCFH